MSIKILFATLLIHHSIADMLDLISPTMNPPISCKFGCEDWSKVVHLWNAKTAPVNAFNNCAQPGGAVDSREYGSWCFCKKANTTPPAKEKTEDLLVINRFPTNSQ